MSIALIEDYGLWQEYECMQCNYFFVSNLYEGINADWDGDKLIPVCPRCKGELENG
jgi:NAD-dependent SIR2 family protein deacetylase